MIQFICQMLENIAGKGEILVTNRLLYYVSTLGGKELTHYQTTKFSTGPNWNILMCI